MDIRATRKALGLSQSEMAKLLGVSQPTVSRLEGPDAKVDLRTKLAIEALQLKSAA